MKKQAGGGAPCHFSPKMREFYAQVTDQYDLEPEALLMLQTACDAWDRAQQAREQLAKEGLILGTRRHPAIDIEAQFTGLFLRALRQLGLDVVPPGPMGRP